MGTARTRTATGGRRRPNGDPKRAVGYLRVSTDDQHLGPQAQRQALLRWCQAHGVELAQVHTDHGVSGATPLDRRPGLLAALDDLRTAGAGVLVVAKRDRLARDVVVAAMIERLVERAGAKVMSATGAGNGDGPEAALMRGLMDLFAQYERAVIGSRTRAALAVKKTKRERVGGIPFGFRLDVDGKRLVEDADEQAVIAELLTLRPSMSLRALAEHCEREGILARNGTWSPTTLSRLFRRLASEAA